VADELCQDSTDRCQTNAVTWQQKLTLDAHVQTRRVQKASAAHIGFHHLVPCTGHSGIYA
jgi:hypothetical protein